MGALTQWAKDNSQYLKLADGEQAEAEYKGYKEVEDQRNPGEMKIRYSLEVDGQIKWLESKSGRLAMEFDKIREGTTIVIKKSGSGSQTRYDISIPGHEEEEGAEVKKK